MSRAGSLKKHVLGQHCDWEADPQALCHPSSSSALFIQLDEAASVTRQAPPVASWNQWVVRNPVPRGPSSSSKRDPFSLETKCSRHYWHSDVCCSCQSIGIGSFRTSPKMTVDLCWTLRWARAASPSHQWYSYRQKCLRVQQLTDNLSFYIWASPHIKLTYNGLDCQLMRSCACSYF